jgi:hypothetical protein
VAASIDEAHAHLTSSKPPYSDIPPSSGFCSPVLLDESFAAGRFLGVTGTPSAVPVDAEGKIASGIAVGAPSVLELA